MHYLQILVLAATAAAGATPYEPCVYEVHDPRDDSKVLASSKNLNSTFVNRGVPWSSTHRDAIAEGKLSIKIIAVCHVNGDQNYHLFQTSQNTRIDVGSHLSQPAYVELSPVQRAHIHEGDTRSLRLDIRITNWIKGQSAIKAASFTKNDDSAALSLTNDPQKVLGDLKAEFYTRPPTKHLNHRFSSPVKAGNEFRFPATWNCIFKSEAQNIKYTLESSGSACLVQAENDWSVWRTMFLLERSGTKAFAPPAERPVHVNENLIFVKNDEDSVTHLSWSQNSLSYWMAVYTKAGNAPQTDGHAQII